MQGEISTLRDGYGFIAGQDGRTYFFHRSGLVNARYVALDEGQAVTFDAVEAERGPRAEHVTLLDVLLTRNSEVA